MKILVLNGSPKGEKSDTMHITRAFLEGMNEAEDNEVHTIHAAFQHIEYCAGCFTCMRNGGECIHHDDMREILDEMMEKKETVMRMLIGETEVPVTWEDNASVEELKGMLPVTVQMSMYGGFEQVGPLGKSIARNDVQTTTEAGDIVLYSGNQIVVFYGSNSWAYTRLGHVDLSRQEMTDLLGYGDVTITFTE